MFKKSCAALLIAAVSYSASAQWVAGLNYTFSSWDDDDTGGELDLSLLGANLGYQYQLYDHFSIVPELRLGVGIDDDTLSTTISGQTALIEAEIEHFVGLTVRAEYNHDSGFYVFVAPTYLNVDLKASDTISGTSASDDEWDYGIGAGLGFNLSESISSEVVYEYLNHFDGGHLFNVGLRYHF